jgi:outer membrane lipoprotein-sorting protein
LKLINRNYRWIVVLLCQIAFWSAIKAQSTEVPPSKIDETSPHASITKAVSGAPTVSALLKSIQRLKTYKFRSSMTVTNAKPPQSNGTFFFKSPKLLRVEVEKPGPKAGTKVVLNAEGNVRVKGMFGITMTLAPDSRLLKLPSGKFVTECDYLSLLNELSREIGSGTKVTASQIPLSLTHEHGKVIVVETLESGHDKNVDQRILIDPKLNVPIRWFGFKNGQLVTTVKFDDVQIDPSIADDMFKI